MKNFMKKAAAAMIAMLAVVAVFGTSVPAQAASKAPKSLSVKVTTKTVTCYNTFGRYGCNLLVA